MKNVIMLTRMGILLRRLALLVGTFVLVEVALLPTMHVAHADAGDDARSAFKEGAALVEQSEWSAALVSFERSFALKPHAITLYNIGVCQRFLGRYTLARQTLTAGLARNDATPGEMPAMFVDQSRAYLTEIDAKIARYQITLEPPTARVSVDGRPLTAVADKPESFVSGIAASGEGQSTNLAKIEVLVDPRPIVLTFALPGYDTIEIQKNPKPGSREEIHVSMTEQPAQLKIASNVRGAVVRVDGVDVGLAPVMISRPPGIRLVAVSMDGFVPYESKFTLKPGQSIPVDAKLSPEKVPITKRWWFWAGAAAVLAGASVVTYFVVRPDPERPAPQAGGLGWIAEVH